MRFMLLKFVPAAGADARPNTEADAAVEHFNLSLHRAGVLLAHDRLLPPSTGAQSSSAPAASTGVLIAYWLIQARSRDEAVAWASRCPVTAPDVIDVRQVMPNDRAAR